MSLNAESLTDFYREYEARCEPLVLATIVQTLGSTYRKAGAQMLIATGGASSGLLSGGCLEGDLAERAQQVLESGVACIVEYDTRGSDDVIWGIGLGCEGAMRIALQRIDPSNDYQPYRFIADSRAANRHGAFAIGIESRAAANPAGGTYLSSEAKAPAELKRGFDKLLSAAPHDPASLEITTADATYLAVRIELPLQLLVLGAGPDAAPLVEIGALLGWQVTVCDHRPAYAVRERFPLARAVRLNPARELANLVKLDDFDAAVVMSHHLPSDQAYLEVLARSRVGYVGLLGPASRRERLLAEIGPLAERINNRLRGPVGLDIGAKTPETIALAISSEIQAYAAGKSGGSYSIAVRQSG